MFTVTTVTVNFPRLIPILTHPLGIQISQIPNLSTMSAKLCNEKSDNLIESRSVKDKIVFECVGIHSSHDVIFNKYKK